MVREWIWVKRSIFLCLEEKSVLWIENFARYEGHELFKKSTPIDALLGLPIQTDEFDPENALWIKVALYYRMISIFNDELTPYLYVITHIKVIVLLVLNPYHHVLEDLGPYFKGVDLRTVFQQRCAGKLRHLLKVHVLNSIC